MPSRYDTGTLLEVRGERWLLTHAAAFESCNVLTLEGRDRDNANHRLRVIDPFDRPVRLSTGRLERRSRQVVLRSALAAIAAARPAAGLWTAAAATIDLWPYQLEPALAAIAGATRLLLADAVGLGKTIQAGLLLAELRERGWVQRTLIVCPAGLRDTWARELHDRFNLTAAIVDQASIAERIATLPPGVNPWSGHAIAIASIDLVKRPEVLAALVGVPIDLLIADEAHHLAPGTDRGAAVAQLAARVPWCVFASATPHSGDEQAFSYLTGLGHCGDPIVIFRRGRGDVGIGSSRRSHLLRVHPTADESALHDAIDRYARSIWQARGREDRAVRLLAVTMARRAASSAAAIERTLVRRLALLGTAPDEPAQPGLPWDDDPADDVEADGVLSAPGLANVDDERRAIGELIALARRCSVGSKINRLLRFLSRSLEPAIVFTEYRDTLEAVMAAVAPSHRVAAIHGGLSLEVRRAAVDAFNDGRVDVLIATDAAGEGLNLHHRCRLVVDVELPWNPLRLEQRIGRVDRLGQRRTVHAVRMFHPRSIEQQVLDHLQLRRQRAEAALDRSPVTERAMATAIFDGTPLERPATPHLRSERVPAAGVEVRRLGDQRRRRRFGAPEPAGALWTPPRSHRPNRWLLLHRVLLVNDRGLPAGDYLDARAVVRPSLRDRREWRRWLERMRTDDVRPLIDHDAGRRRTEIIAALAPGRDAVDRRIRVIRSRLDRFRVLGHQASLFDRRAERDAVARQHDVALLDAALLDTQERVGAAIGMEGVRVELVAAWPERRR